MADCLIFIFCILLAVIVLFYRRRLKNVEKQLKRMRSVLKSL